MKTKLNLNSILFLIAFGIITIIALMLIWTSTCRPFKIVKLDDMKQANYDDYLNKKGVKFGDDDSESYYVYIYSDDYETNDWYKDIVIEYANYSRTHSSTRPIYAYNLDIKENEKLINDLGTSVTLGKDIPGLVLVKNKSINTKYYTYAKLNNELTDAMNK